MGNDLEAQWVSGEDVQSVIDDFESEHEEVVEHHEAGDEALAVALAALQDCQDEYALYLRAKEFDMTDDQTAIRDDHFVDYVQEMLADCGDIPKELPHYIVIDWEATADNIKQDYAETTVGSDTYWVS